jgi:hypothetical protein
MRITGHGATLVVLLLAGTSNGSAAVLDVPVTPLIIRIYDAPPLATTETNEALAEAKAILTAAGFAPEWLMCQPQVTPGGRCALPLSAAELAVRVVTAPAVSGPIGRTPLPLGYSLVDVQTQSGALATIYLDRVRWLASAADARVPMLLGRAIVHEIGHLLLGHQAHSRGGVMRAVWTREAIYRSRAADWRFSGQEAQRMREAVTLRSAKEKLAKHAAVGD